MAHPCPCPQAGVTLHLCLELTERREVRAKQAGFIKEQGGAKGTAVLALAGVFAHTYVPRSSLDPSPHPDQKERRCFKSAG